MSERVGSSEIATITGFSLRKVQMLAGQGKIPSAARLAGGCWTFDPIRVRAWVRGSEKCQEISTGAAMSGGRDIKFEARSIDEAYERLFAPKRASASNRS